jgi:hypothetical protein
MDPHHFGMLDMDLDQNGKLDLDPYRHQNEMV